MAGLMRRALSVVLAICAGCALPTFGLAANDAASTKPAAEPYTRPPAILSAVVSPSGTRLAVIVTGASGFHQVGVMNLDPIGEPRVVGSFEDADVANVQWVNDDRLVYSAHRREAFAYDAAGGTFAVNHDGSEARLLIAVTRATSRPGSNLDNRVLPYDWSLHSVAGDGSDDVFVTHWIRDNRGEPNRVELARLNARTGALRPLSAGMPQGTRQWLLDARREPRVAIAVVDGRTRIHWRDGTDGPWTQLADFDPLKEEGFAPLLVEPDGRIIVRRYAPSGVLALYAYDPVGRRMAPEPLVAVNGFDVGGDLQVDTATRRWLGLHLVADRPVSVWLDPSLDRVQRSVDAALPGRFNRLLCGRCETTRFFAVLSQSDRQPGEYYLFDRDRSSMQRMGARYPWIDEATQGTRTFHRFAARDGLSIPVVVTHPSKTAADTPLPAVLMVHGGPWLRGGDLTWEAEAQFLASRGYRVLEPEFRGSQGFGWRHFHAGWKQWGRAMQDDLADAVQWAASQRLVDPSRVCIYGGSYGGYAALMAPIAHPGTFRCAASYAGVTDIEMMFSITWSDATEALKRYGLPVLVGDLAADATQLKQTSPLKRAAEIKVPVLLAQGAADLRVPIDHAKDFATAARKAGVAIDTVYYNDEGHGWGDPAHHADFLGRLEKLLAASTRSPP